MRNGRSLVIWRRVLAGLVVAAVFSVICSASSAGPKASTGNGKAPPEASPPAQSLEAQVEKILAPEITERERILQIALSRVGNTETHGNNRSPLIDSMNRLTGVPMGSPYCASFNSWCYDQAGIDRTRWPLTAWSPSWVARPTWTRAKGGKTPLPADAFGLYWDGRTRHTGMIVSWGEGKSATTVEANTAPTSTSGDQANGDGIWKKKRLKTQINSVRNWLN